MTCDDLMREVSDLEEAMRTRPRIVSVVALGAMNGTSTIYDMPRKFSPDDPDDDDPRYPPIPDVESGPAVSYPAPGVVRRRLPGPILKYCTSYADTLGPAAVLTEIHRCILRYLPACRSVVPCRWMDVIPPLCYGASAVLPPLPHPCPGQC